MAFGKYCASDAFEPWKRSKAHDWQMKFEGHRHVGIGVACGLREDGSTFLFAVNKFAHATWPGSPVSAPPATGGGSTPVATTTPNTGTSATDALASRGSADAPAENTMTNVGTTPTTGTTASSTDCNAVEDYGVWYGGAMTRHNRLPAGYCLLSPGRRYALALTRSGELIVSRVQSDYEDNGELHIQTCSTTWRAPATGRAATLRVAATGNLCLNDGTGQTWCALNGAGTNALPPDGNVQLRLSDSGQLQLIDTSGWVFWSAGSE